MELKKLQDIISNYLDIDPKSITEESSFKDMEVDSLDMVELICDIEDQCEVDFGEPTDLVTIGDIVEHIDSLK